MNKYFPARESEYLELNFVQRSMCYAKRFIMNITIGQINLNTLDKSCSKNRFD